MELHVGAVIWPRQWYDPRAQELDNIGDFCVRTNGISLGIAVPLAGADRWVMYACQARRNDQGT